MCSFCCIGPDGQCLHIVVTEQQSSSPTDASSPSALPGGVPWSPVMPAPGEHPPPGNGGRYPTETGFHPGALMPPAGTYLRTAPESRSCGGIGIGRDRGRGCRDRDRVTVFLTRSHTTPQAGSGAGAAPASFASFEAEYPATKGAIARIDTIGCNGSACVGTGFAIDARHIAPPAMSCRARPA